MNHIKEFLPFILPILTAIVGYIFGQKTSKVNRFYSQNENNLKNVIEPLYFCIKSIKREKSTFQKEKLLDKLFDSYILENKGIYQIGNKDLVDAFINLENVYYEFKKEKNEVKWKTFWIELEYYYVGIEREYWNNFHTLFKEYNWYLHSLNRSIFAKIWFEVIRFLKDTIRFLSLISFGFVMFCLYDKVLKVTINKGYLPEGYVILSSLLLLFCIVIYAFISIFDVFSPNSSQQKGYMDKLIGKNTGKNKKFEQNIKIPKMYE